MSTAPREYIAFALVCVECVEGLDDKIIKLYYLVTARNANKSIEMLANYNSL